MSIYKCQKMEDYFTCIPHELITKILAHLDFKTLCRLSPTCKTLRSCAYVDALWVPLCRLYWLDMSREKSDISWRQNFIEWYKDFGRYIDIYPRIKLLWEEILQSLQNKCIRAFYSMNVTNPATEQMLDDLESLLGHKFPEDMRCSYRICNGQILPTQLLDDTSCGFLGQVTVYQYTINEVFCSVDMMKRCFTIRSERFPDKLKSIEITNRFLYVSERASHGEIGFHMKICLEDMGIIKRGHIYIQADEGRSKNGAMLLFAKNFTEWLENQIIRLKHKELIIVDNTILQFIHKPEWEATTRDVKISVAIAFVPEFSSLNCIEEIPRLMFTYRITFSMDNSIHPRGTCFLRTRHWDIVENISESNQRTQAVDGPGVIGFFPEMTPGASFSYVSWTPMTTNRGRMFGSFQFQSRRDEKNVFDVECPEFRLHCPELKNFKYE